MNEDEHTGAHAPPSRWDDLQGELVGLLQDLLRFDTTNPPGNETPCLEYIARVLDDDGIPSTIMESAPTRGNLVARIEAVGEPIEAPLLLLAHVDVVAADADKWTHPPFEGVVHDGFVWGRGTLDMKGPAATWITIVRALKRWRVQLKRDVILMLNADEEAGGGQGAVWMAEHHPELLACAAALNEGGGMAIAVGEQRYFAYAVDEKPSVRFTLRSRGRSGHAAIPHDDNALVHIGRAVSAVGRARVPARITEVFARCITAIADAQPPALRAQLLEALDPGRVDQVLDDHVPYPLRERLRAMVRTTFVPTYVGGGSKENLIPEEAEARFNCRALPDEDTETVRWHLERILDEEGVRHAVAIELPPLPSFPASPPDSPLMESMQWAMEQHAPGVPLIPTVGIAGSDSRHLRPIGIHAYGFYPMLPEVDPRLFHNVDERISLRQLAFATRVVGDAVLDFCERK